MIHWWSSLSWAHATIMTIVAAWALLLTWIVGMNWLRATLGGNRRAIPPRRATDCILTDYSKKRQERLDQLGERYLLAQPVNRRRR